MITDGELLAACRSAGEPGTESHRLACRLYRQSVLEWRAGHAHWRAEYEARVTVSLLVALLGEAAGEEGLLAGRGCGTYLGYKRHSREKTPACPSCKRAWADYKREWNRARKTARVAALAGQVAA